MICKEMILGERQTIALEFSRSDGGIISEGSYSMHTPSREWVEDMAVAINDNVVSFLFEPAEIGIYILEALVVYQDGQTDVEQVQVTVIGGR